MVFARFFLGANNKFGGCAVRLPAATCLQSLLCVLRRSLLKSYKYITLSGEDGSAAVNYVLVKLLCKH